MILSARFSLFCALIGAFILAYMASNRPDLPGLYVLIAYSVLVVLPLVALAWGGQKGA